MEKEMLALLGDVGGTNIRFELVAVDLNSVVAPKVLKRVFYDVELEDNFQAVI